MIELIVRALVTTNSKFLYSIKTSSFISIYALVIHGGGNVHDCIIRLHTNCDGQL